MDRTSLDILEKPKDPNSIIPLSGSGKRFLILGLPLGILSVLIIIILGIKRGYTYKGSMIEPPFAAEDFQLSDQDGNIFSLSQQRGKVVLLFFGYTHCPDVCPVTLYDFKVIRERLGERSNELRFVFITVDPERDTPDVLKNHLNKFDREIIGLSDDPSTMEDVWVDYGVAVVQREVENTTNYFVDHTARVYVIDRSGMLRLTYPFGFEVEKIIDDIDHLLRENGN